jgi:rubrerythrin
LDLHDRLSSIEVAIENEVRERELYLKKALRSSNPVCRATFETLADEELNHIESLKELHKALRREGRWPDNLNLTVRTSRVNEVVSNFINKYREVFENDPETLQTSRAAIEIEDKSTKFYLNIRDRVEDLKEKDFFQDLANVELEHCRALKSTEQHLIDPEVWLRLREEP